MFVEIVETRKMRECLKPAPSTYLATVAVSHVHTELDILYTQTANEYSRMFCFQTMSATGTPCRKYWGGSSSISDKSARPREGRVCPSPAALGLGSVLLLWHRYILGRKNTWNTVANYVLIWVTLLWARSWMSPRPKYLGGSSPSHLWYRPVLKCTDGQCCTDDRA